MFTFASAENLFVLGTGEGFFDGFDFKFAANFWQQQNDSHVDSLHEVDFITQSDAHCDENGKCFEPSTIGEQKIHRWPNYFPIRKMQDRYVSSVWSYENQDRNWITS